MTTGIALAGLPDSFRESMREKILGMFIEAVPQAEFDAMLNKEIKAFFEDEQILLMRDMKIKSQILMETAAITAPWKTKWQCRRQRPR